jgi:multiple sugar transport system ATP-binding protein
MGPHPNRLDQRNVAMAMTPKALEIRHLVKSYGPVQVLKDVSADIEKGEFLVLVGPSGCGKSTLLNCIAGLDEITSGSLLINGRDVGQLPPRDRNIAMVFQSYALYPTMSVAENIAFGMKIRRMDAATIKTKVGEVANLLQIGHLLDRRPSQLSGGQRQRVAMGRALVRDPALFLFDEPLSNLDAKLRVEMRAEIKRVHQTTHASIVYVTHDQIEAMTLATKIVVLRNGEVQQIGTPDEIYNAPANTFVADFMGVPPMNLIPARIEGATLHFGEASLTLDALPKVIAGRSKIIVGIRAETFGPGKALSVQPTMVEHTGSDAYVNFRLGDTPVTARLSGRVPIPAGRIGLDVDAATLRYFDEATGLRVA